MLISSPRNFSKIVLANNVYERTTASGTVVADTSARTWTDFLLWHNTFAGQRFNHENDWTTPTNYWIVNWSGKYNVFDSRGNHLGDVRATSGALIGYWSVDNSVGWEGNYNCGTAFAGDQDFWGLWSNYPIQGPPSDNISFATPKPVAGWVSNYSTSGTSAGSGNYSLSSSSSAINMGQRDWLLPYDLSGNARGRFDPPGAYSSASPRKGGGFF